MYGDSKANPRFDHGRGLSTRHDTPFYAVRVPKLIDEFKFKDENDGQTKTGVTFRPMTSSTMLQALKDNAAEIMEWRYKSSCQPNKLEPPTPCIKDYMIMEKTGTAYAKQSRGPLILPTNLLKGLAINIKAATPTSLSDASAISETIKEITEESKEKKLKVLKVTAANQMENQRWAIEQAFGMIDRVKTCYKNGWWKDSPSGTAPAYAMVGDGKWTPTIKDFALTKDVYDEMRKNNEFQDHQYDVFETLVAIVSELGGFPQAIRKGDMLQAAPKGGNYGVAKAWPNVPFFDQSNSGRPEDVPVDLEATQVVRVLDVLIKLLPIREGKDRTKETAKNFDMCLIVRVTPIYEGHDYEFVPVVLGRRQCAIPQFQVGASLKEGATLTATVSGNDTKVSVQAGDHNFVMVSEEDLGKATKGGKPEEKAKRTQAPATPPKAPAKAAAAPKAKTEGATPLAPVKEEPREISYEEKRAYPTPKEMREKLDDKLASRVWITLPEIKENRGAWANQYLPSTSKASICSSHFLRSRVEAGMQRDTAFKFDRYDKFIREPTRTKRWGGFEWRNQHKNSHWKSTILMLCKCQDISGEKHFRFKGRFQVCFDKGIASHPEFAQKLFHEPNVWHEQTEPPCAIRCLKGWTKDTEHTDIGFIEYVEYLPIAAKDFRFVNHDTNHKGGDGINKSKGLLLPGGKRGDRHAIYGYVRNHDYDEVWDKENHPTRDHRMFPYSYPFEKKGGGNITIVIDTLLSELQGIIWLYEGNGTVSALSAVDLNKCCVIVIDNETGQYLKPWGFNCVEISSTAAINDQTEFVCGPNADLGIEVYEEPKGFWIPDSWEMTPNERNIAYTKRPLKDYDQEAPDNRNYTKEERAGQGLTEVFRQEWERCELLAKCAEQKHQLTRTEMGYLPFDQNAEFNPKIDPLVKMVPPLKGVEILKREIN